MGSVVPGCIASCEPMVGMRITSKSSDSGGRRTCRCLQNSSVTDGYPDAAAKTVASVDVPNTRITFGRAISLLIVQKRDEKSVQNGTKCEQSGRTAVFEES